MMAAVPGAMVTRRAPSATATSWAPERRVMVLSPPSTTGRTAMEWGQMGTGYLRSLFALGFQGFLILVCVAIYAALVQTIPSSGDIHGAIWGTAGYTVLLAFALFKTGSLSKSIFNAR